MEQGDMNANVVQAKHFQLVDDENKVRAQLGTGPDGSSVALEFYQDDRETSRLSVGIDPNGAAAVALRDDAGGTRARLAVEPSGTPTTFNIRDAVNRIRALSNSVRRGRLRGLRRRRPGSI